MLCGEAPQPKGGLGIPLSAGRAKSPDSEIRLRIKGEFFRDDLDN